MSLAPPTPGPSPPAHSLSAAASKRTPIPWPHASPSWAGPRLRVIEPSKMHAHSAGTLIELGTQPATFSIGRDELSSLLLRDLHVSRAHARLLINQNGTLSIEDTQSTWGTWLNGERLTQPHPLYHGDLLVLGATALIVEHFAQALRDQALQSLALHSLARAHPAASAHPHLSLVHPNPSPTTPYPLPQPDGRRNAPIRPIAAPARLPALWEQNLRVACLLILAFAAIHYLIFIFL